MLGDVTRLRFAAQCWLCIEGCNGAITVNGGKATSTEMDISASNAVIHIVDAVLIPFSLQVPLPNTVLAQLPRNEFHRFNQAIVAGHLGLQLNMPGPYTVFAPQNGAFTAMGQEWTNMLNAEGAELLDMLNYHVMDGAMTQSQLKAKARSGDPCLTTLMGDDICLSVGGGNYLMINDVAKVTSSYSGTNRVVDVIDTCLSPPVEVEVASCGFLGIGCFVSCLFGGRC